VREISVQVKFFDSRQPVKSDANSGKQVAIVGCFCWGRMCVWCVRVCGAVFVCRLSFDCTFYVHNIQSLPSALISQ
jgi:hypothetical protein